MHPDKRRDGRAIRKLDREARESRAALMRQFARTRASMAAAVEAFEGFAQTLHTLNSTKPKGNNP